MADRAAVSSAELHSNVCCYAEEFTSNHIQMSGTDYTLLVRKTAQDKEGKKKVPYMAKSSPSNQICLQPNFP